MSGNPELNQSPVFQSIQPAMPHSGQAGDAGVNNRTPEIAVQPTLHFFS
jgi:hypothetical protein